MYNGYYKNRQAIIDLRKENHGLSEKEIEIKAYPVRYFSMVTVPQEFAWELSKVEGKVLENGESLNGKALIEAIKQGKSRAFRLSPYLLLLFEVEGGGAYWTYMDMAGELSKIRFIDGSDNYVAAEKVVYANGGYIYKVHQVLLGRNNHVMK